MVQTCGSSYTALRTLHLLVLVFIIYHILFILLISNYLFTVCVFLFIIFTITLVLL